MLASLPCNSWIGSNAKGGPLKDDCAKEPDKQRVEAILDNIEHNLAEAVAPGNTVAAEPSVAGYYFASQSNHLLNETGGR